MVRALTAPVLALGLPCFFVKIIDTFREPFFGTTASLVESPAGRGVSVNVTFRAESIVPVAAIVPPLGNCRLVQFNLFDDPLFGSSQVMSMLWIFSGCVVSEFVSVMSNWRLLGDVTMPLPVVRLHVGGSFRTVIEKCCVQVPTVMTHSSVWIWPSPASVHASE